MLRGEADCAVHSLKDVPMALDEPFVLPAILERADAADALVSTHTSLQSLPAGARVGTSSLRRQAQLRAARPDLQLLDLRGNVNTRLAKLDQGDYDAIVLACAGLDRLGLGHRIGARLAAPHWLPAPAQGAIAVESRGDDPQVMELLSVLDHVPTRECVEAERAMNRALHGSCHVPVAAFAQHAGERLHLQALVGDAGDGRLVRAEAEGVADDREALGREVARQLLAAGGDLLLGPYAN